MCFQVPWNFPFGAPYEGLQYLLSGRIWWFTFQSMGGITTLWGASMLMLIGRAARKLVGPGWGLRFSTVTAALSAVGGNFGLRALLGSFTMAGQFRMDYLPAIRAITVFV